MKKRTDKMKWKNFSFLHLEDNKFMCGDLIKLANYKSLLGDRMCNFKSTIKYLHLTGSAFVKFNLRELVVF